MEFAEIIKTVIKERGVYLNSQDMLKETETLSKFYRKYPRIPNIISRFKEYEGFKIINWKNKEKNILILIKDTTFELPKEFIIEDVLIELNINYFTYKEILSKLIPNKSMLGSFEIIGNIVHLNLNKDQVIFKEIIGKVINFKTGMTVINKIGQIEEKYRFYDLEILAGNHDLKTIHIENGIKIYIDLANVYWCSRLQTERLKILNKLKIGESICDPFCGCGPQVLIALKHGVKAYANDLNPAAISCLKKSLLLNNLYCEKIDNIDASEFLKSLINTKIDHFVFNLPNFSLDYIKYILNNKNFTLHCFFFCTEEFDPINFIYMKTGLKLERKFVYEVRKVSPSKSVWKLEINDIDLKLSSLNYVVK